MSVLLIAIYLAAAALAAGAAAFLGRRPPGAVLAALALLPLVFFWEGVFRDRTPIPVDHTMLLPPWSELRPVSPRRYNVNLNDVAMQMAPWAKAVRMAWKEGSLPLRLRWNGSGMALAGNSQSAAFSPLTFLMFPLPLAYAFTLAAAVKLLLALLGAWLWISELRVSRTGALFGSVSFGLSLAITPWLLFPHTAVICLWPWALFAIERLRDETTGSRAVWLLTAVFFCWAVGGHPESVALGAVFIGLWLFGRLLLRDLSLPGKLAARIALSASIALGLSAFLLVTQALAIGDSNRVPYAKTLSGLLPFRLTPHGPFWPDGLVTPFFPRALGDQIDSPRIEGSVGSYPEMALGYFGIIGWACALAILRPGSRRRRAELALLVPLLVGFAAAVGQWPIHEILHVTPLLRLMFQVRFFTFVALAGSAIAAFELDRLREDLSQGRRSAALVLLIPVALAGYALAEFRRFRPAYEASGGLASERAALALALISLGVAAALFAIASLKPSAVVITGCFLLLVAASAAELLYQGMRLYRFGSPADLYPDTPMLAFLRSRPGPFRVLGEGAVLFPNANIFAGLEDIRTHDPVERGDYVRYLDACCGYKPYDYFKFLQNFDSPALDRLNLKYLVSIPGRGTPGPKWKPVYSGSDGTLFENTTALPRVFSRTANPVVVSDYREATNRVSFRANVSGTGQTLLVASFVDDGSWSARDEGRPLPLVRAEEILIGFRLSPGEHRVTLRYRPPGFAAGSAISLVTLALLLSWAVGWRLLARRGDPT
jgi:hypothetical protein